MPAASSTQRCAAVAEPTRGGAASERERTHAAAFATSHSGPECNQSAPKVIFPTFHFWHFLASLLKLTPLSTMYIYLFPLKFILYMEIFLSKLKFHSTFYKNMSFNTLCKFMIKISVLSPICWKDRISIKNWRSYNIPKMHFEKFDSCFKISKERWNYIINFHYLNFSKE